MSITLIIGPMKSGKSLELIARIAPYEFANKKVLYVQPEANVRDEGVVTRNGLKVTARKVKSLKEIKNGFDVIGVDEMNMFAAEDVEQIDKWVKAGKEVVISGLDLDYRGQMFESIAKIHELKPSQIILKLAVCDVCKAYAAPFTQILADGKPMLGGDNNLLPEDGTYVYEARCRKCFVRS